MPELKSHPRRGENYDLVARAFLQQFPVYTLLTTEEFDVWAFAGGWLVPPESVERGSAAWTKHVVNRDTLIAGINMASTHDRMFKEHGLQAFRLARGKKPGTWRVMPPLEAIGEHLEMSASESSLLAKRRRMRYDIEALDQNRHPPHVIREARNLAIDMDTIYDVFMRQTQAYNDKCDRFLADVKAEVEAYRRGRLDALPPMEA
jgi:hypothetical protein